MLIIGFFEPRRSPADCGNGTRSSRVIRADLASATDAVPLKKGPAVVVESAKSDQSRSWAGIMNPGRKKDMPCSCRTLGAM